MSSSPLLRLQATASAAVAFVLLIVWAATGASDVWPLWIWHELAVALALHYALRRALLRPSAYRVHVALSAVAAGAVAGVAGDARRALRRRARGPCGGVAAERRRRELDRLAGARARGRARGTRAVPRARRPGRYGVVVESVNVSVLPYAPVRSASFAPIPWRKPSVTASLLTGPA
jgi:hypothetical protein